MFRRALWLGLLLVMTQLASGCCYLCHRPYFFPRLHPFQNAGFYGGACCDVGGAPGCDCGGGHAAFHPEYGAPPIAPVNPTGPMMPPATPLTRR